MAPTLRAQPVGWVKPTVWRRGGMVGWHPSYFLILAVG